jgi:hypothetical protein
MKGAEIVFLFDVDTLLDNVQDHLREHEQAYGSAACNRYWKIFEELRSELDTPTILARWSAIGSRTNKNKK